MGDYRKMFDSKYLANWDLDGDETRKIKTVVAGEVEGEKGEKTKCPLVYFNGAPEPHHPYPSQAAHDPAGYG